MAFYLNPDPDSKGLNDTLLNRVGHKLYYRHRSSMSYYGAPSRDNTGSVVLLSSEPVVCNSLQLLELSMKKYLYGLFDSASIKFLYKIPLDEINGLRVWNEANAGVFYTGGFLGLSFSQALSFVGSSVSYGSTENFVSIMKSIRGSQRFMFDYARFTYDNTTVFRELFLHIKDMEFSSGNKMKSMNDPIIINLVDCQSATNNLIDENRFLGIVQTKYNIPSVVGGSLTYGIATEIDAEFFVQ